VVLAGANVRAALATLEAVRVPLTVAGVFRELAIDRLAAAVTLRVVMLDVVLMTEYLATVLVELGHLTATHRADKARGVVLLAADLGDLRVALDVLPAVVASRQSGTVTVGAFVGTRAGLVKVRGAELAVAL